MNSLHERVFMPAKVLKTFFFHPCWYAYGTLVHWRVHAACYLHPATISTAILYLTNSANCIFRFLFPFLIRLLFFHFSIFIFYYCGLMKLHIECTWNDSGKKALHFTEKRNTLKSSVRHNCFSSALIKLNCLEREPKKIACVIKMCCCCRHLQNIIFYYVLNWLLQQKKDWKNAEKMLILFKAEKIVFFSFKVSASFL